MARKYSKKSQEDVRSAMHKFKRGKLKSGKSKTTVKNRKQAIAIGLSEARAEGKKVPAAPKRKTVKRDSTKAKTATRKNSSSAVRSSKKKTTRSSSKQRTSAQKK